MFLKNKLFMTVLVVLILAGMSLSACASVQTAQPTRLPSSTFTSLPLFTETPILTATITLEPTETWTPAATLTAELTSTIDPGQVGFRYEAPTSMSSLENASKEEIVTTLLRKWLEFNKTDAVREYQRLKDYKIEKITVTDGYCPPPNKDTRKFAARAQFSVQTVDAYTGDWVTFPGNAIFGDDNWIYYLSPYVSISASNGIYTFGLEGSVPCG
jgi:hypothetical protein